MSWDTAPLGLIRIARQFLSGDEQSIGLYAEKAEALTALLDAKAEIQHWTVCDPQEGFSTGDAYYDHLQAQVLVYSDSVRVFEKEIAFYQRLLDPELMQEVYRWLEGFGEAEWALFVLSARQARLDFETFRKLKKRAQEISAAIEVNAKQLARQIRELRDTGVVLPSALMPFWEDGAVGEGIGGSSESKHAKLHRMIHYVRHSGSDVKSKDAVRWLFDIAKAAASVEARFACPAVSAAIAKRQNSKKSAYLRAFAALLEDGHIELTPRVIKAMAVTANVVFDAPDFEASEDDVRKAIGRTSDQL